MMLSSHSTLKFFTPQRLYLSVHLLHSALLHRWLHLVSTPELVDSGRLIAFDGLKSIRPQTVCLTSTLLLVDQRY